MAEASEGLPRDVIFRNNVVRLYYLSVRERLVSLYESLNGSVTWTPEHWERFVNSDKLEDMVCTRLGELSQLTREKIAPSQPEQQWDSALRIDETPLNCVSSCSGDSQCDRAAQQFKKVLLHLFLKDIFGFDFVVMGREFPGMCRVSTELWYVRTS